MTLRVRWVAPVVVTALVGGTATLAGAADAAPALPAKTPEQLLAMVAQSRVAALSGVVQQSSRLGLPQLPRLLAEDPDPASLSALLTGNSTYRVWVDGPERARVQVLGPLTETNLVRNGRHLWTYRSATNEATHAVLPGVDARQLEGQLRQQARQQLGRQQLGRPQLDQQLDRQLQQVRSGLAAAGLATPDGLARQLVAGARLGATVQVGQVARVAGRPAYELQLRPRSATTLLAQAAVAVDAETGLALRVRLHARGQAEPAYELGFSDVQLGTPPATRFAFTAPPGASVRHVAAPSALPAGLPAVLSAGQLPAPVAAVASLPAGLAGSLTVPELTAAAARRAGVSPAQLPRLVGSGYDAVLVVPAAAAPPAGTLAQLDQMLATSSRRVPAGRLVQTALLSLLVTDDGRWVIGAVTPARLAAAAG